MIPALLMLTGLLSTMFSDRPAVDDHTKTTLKK
jgi:hypothetical protein